jgi:DNA-binding transcriptional LysR family regulator
MIGKIAACLVVVVLAGPPALAAQTNDPPPYPWQPEEPQQGYWTQTWHDGFRAGATAANQDVRAKLPPDPERHAHYSKPDLAPVASEEYRAGFVAAYNLVQQHFANLH